MTNKISQMNDGIAGTREELGRLNDNVDEVKGGITKVKDRVVRHFRENKRTYIGIVASSAVTALTMTAKQIVVTDAFKIAWKIESTNTVTTTLVRRGHPGMIVKCNETGELFPSVSRAAEAYGINRPNLTSHLHGRLPHVGGKTFTVLGEMV